MNYSITVSTWSAYNVDIGLRAARVNGSTIGYFNNWVGTQGSGSGIIYACGY
ncbi:MAG: hypothetical protein ACRC6E_07850 [Fusobacteriaceae bacterium]